VTKVIEDVAAQQGGPLEQVEVLVAGTERRDHQSGDRREEDYADADQAERTRGLTEHESPGPRGSAPPTASSERSMNGAGPHGGLREAARS
jgi:hypothetical protein